MSDLSPFFPILRKMRLTHIAWCGVFLWICSVALPDETSRNLRLLGAFQEHRTAISLCGIVGAAYLSLLPLYRMAHTLQLHLENLCRRMKLRKIFRNLGQQQRSVVHRFLSAGKSCMALPSDGFAVNALVQAGILQDEGEPEADDLRNRYEKLHLYRFTRETMEYLIGTPNRCPLCRKQKEANNAPCPAHTP